MRDWWWAGSPGGMTKPTRWRDGWSGIAEGPGGLPAGSGPQRVGVLATALGRSGSAASPLRSAAAEMEKAA